MHVEALLELFLVEEVDRVLAPNLRLVLVGEDLRALLKRSNDQ